MSSPLSYPRRVDPAGASSTGSAPGEVTELLRRWSGGDEDAPARLLPLVYDDLRRLASGYSWRERRHRTLQATDLVHEVYIQMFGRPANQPIGFRWLHRGQFLGVAARLMRRILVDYARERQAAKRGGHLRRVPLPDELVDPAGRSAELLALDAALEELERFSPRDARVVEMRYFGGLTTEEMADHLGLSARTVARSWRRARAWLRLRLEETSGRGSVSVAAHR